jgi:hypothetical protein
MVKECENKESATAGIKHPQGFQAQLLQHLLALLLHLLLLLLGF